MIPLKIHLVRAALLLGLSSGALLAEYGDEQVAAASASILESPPAIFDGKHFSYRQGDIELVAELMFLPSRASVKDTEPISGEIRVLIWLVNRSPKEMKLLTKRKHGFQLSARTLIFSYVPTTVKGHVVRERESEIGLLTLKENEAVSVESETIPIKNIHSKDNAFQVTYLIDPKCEELYGVWTGRLNCEFNPGQKGQADQQGRAKFRAERRGQVADADVPPSEPTP